MTASYPLSTRSTTFRNTRPFNHSQVPSCLFPNFSEHTTASPETCLIQAPSFSLRLIPILAKVYADTSGGGTVVPYLYLDGTRGVDGSSGLPAVPSLVVDAGSPSISDEITFVYTVEVGDSIASAVLEVEGISAIRDGDAPLVDLLGRAADVTLPVVGSAGSLSAASSLSIDATQPVVVAVGSSLDGGEYGVGQVRVERFAAERTSNGGNPRRTCNGSLDHVLRSVPRAAHRCVNSIVVE